MRAAGIALVFALAALAAPRAALAQGASALGSPWGPGRGPTGTEAEPPQDIHAEGEDGASGSSGGVVSGGVVVGGAASGGGLVVPEGYAPAVVPSPGVYPGAPRIVTEDPLHLPAGIVTRLRALDADLQIVAAHGGSSILDIVMAFVLGGASIGVGIAFDEAVTGRPSPTSPYMYTLGAGLIARGILDLALATNPSEVATTYAHMPMRTHREVRERLLYGERELAHLAEMGAISRYLDGGLNIALGLLIVPVYLVPNGFREDDVGGYLVLLGAAISVTTGLISMFTVGEAERRWGAYSQLRDQLAATTDGADDDSELEEAAGDDRRALGPSVTGRLGVGGLSLDGTF